MLLVSHALDQIVRFCDETVWIDRGRIAMRGPSVEVVKAYEKFIRELDDKRLLAKNRKMKTRRLDAFDREGYTDQFTVRLSSGDRPGDVLDISELVLLKDGEPDDRLAVGAAQDADPMQSASLRLDISSWQTPQTSEDGYFRRLETVGDPAASPAIGHALFHLWFYYPDAEYVLEVRHRGDAAEVALGRNTRLDSYSVLPASEEWTTTTLVYREPVELDEEDEEGDDRGRRTEGRRHRAGASADGRAR